MRHLRILTLVLLSACALGAVAASGASAHEFVASEASKLVGTAESTFAFTTAAGREECTKVEITAGTSTKGSFKTLNESLQFSGCKAFGESLAFGKLELALSAEGTLSLLTGFTMKGAACEVKYPAQGPLSSVTYINSGKGLLVTWNLSGITSEATGTACEYAKESKGTASFKMLVTLAGGGTLEWK